MSSNYTTADYEAIIANYTLHAVRSELWSHAADLTRECVHAFNVTPDNTNRDALHNTLSCVSKLAAWVWMSYGAVTIETVFHPDIIGNYFPAGDGVKFSPSTAGTQRSLLCCVTEVINDDWNPGCQHPISYEPTLEPYDSYACDRVWDQVESQPAVVRRRNFITVLVLTLGVDLHTGEICTLRGKDVHVDGDGVLLFPHGYHRVGPRRVPLFRSHTEVLQPVVMATGLEDYLFRPGRDNENISQFSAYLRRVTPGTSSNMVLNIRRPHNTWIIDRIAAEVPADVPYVAARLKSLHQFEDYVVEAGANHRHAYRILLAEGSTHSIPDGGLYVL